MSKYLRRGLYDFISIRSVPKFGQRWLSTLNRSRNFKPNVTARTGQRMGQSSELLSTVRCFTSVRDNMRPFRQILWKFIRGLFILTGGVVWFTPLIFYIGAKTGFIKVEINEDENESESNRHEERLFSIFDVSKDDQEESRAKEINEKSSALMKIWNKLKFEEGVLQKFGDPVDLIGYRGKSRVVYKPHIFDYHQSITITPNDQLQDLDTATEIKTDERRKKNGIVDWCVACVVAGPKQTGILEMEFNKVNSEWIPISLHLEGLQKTGEVICDVSGPLPNGITRFTRLSNE